MERGVIVGVLLVISLFAGIPAAIQFTEASNPDYTCTVDVMPGVARANASELVEARGEFSTFPLGLQCTFTTTDGATITVGPGWFATVLAAIALGSLATALLTATIRRQSQHEKAAYD